MRPPALVHSPARRPADSSHAPVVSHSYSAGGCAEPDPGWRRREKKFESEAVGRATCAESAPRRVNQYDPERNPLLLQVEQLHRTD